MFYRDGGKWSLYIFCLSHRNEANRALIQNLLRGNEAGGECHSHRLAFIYQRVAMVGDHTEFPGSAGTVVDHGDLALKPEMGTILYVPYSRTVHKCRKYGSQAFSCIRVRSS